MTPFYHAIQLPLFATSKVCPDCRKEKVLEDFYKNKHASDGLTTYCKACTKVRVELYRTTHPEQYKASIQIHNRKYREMHPEYQREWSAIHPEQCRSYLAKYEENNRDKRLEMRSDPLYREGRRIYGAKWAKENRLRLRQRDMRRKSRERAVTIGEVDYERILARDGYWCHICERDILPHQKLEFDHVIPIDRNGPHVEWNIKPSHRFCNRRKSNLLMEELTAWHRSGPS